ncbi:MAG: response regulator transcription factor [Chloroflexi bacterium]|nr:response regulator transcription factor [Chloroflexota bacterium]
MTTLNVLVIADDPLVRAGLTMVLKDTGQCAVVGQESSAAELATAVSLYQPDVIAWDLGWDSLQNQDAMTRLSDLSEAFSPVLALVSSTEEEMDTVVAVWATGIQGLLLRDADGKKLVAAMQAVAADLSVIEPHFARALFRSTGTLIPAQPEALTPRELEVLHLVAEGLPNKTIAQQLEIPVEL